MATTPGPEQPCEFKREGGLGGWRRGTVVRHLDGGRKVEVKVGRETYVLLASRVRPPKDGAPERPSVSSLARTAAPFVREHVEDMARRAREDEPTQEFPVEPPPKAERIEKARAIVSIPKPDGPARDPEYLAFVRQHPCCACGHAGPDIEAHHFGPRGMGQKTSDYLTVPLCFECHHEEFHKKGSIGAVTVRYPACPPALVRLATEHCFYQAQARLLNVWVSRTVTNVL